MNVGFSGGSVVKKHLQCRKYRRFRFDSWVGKIPWRRTWQAIPVFLLGISHGQRNPASYHPYGPKESDMTEHTYTRR